MNSVNASRTALFILLLTTIAIAQGTSAYQKGTITQDFSAKQKSYELKGSDNGYRINDCGDFQNGQVVDYRVKDNKVYIRREDGKESKCAIEATISPTVGPTIADESASTSTYRKGTIEGYEMRYRKSRGGVGSIRTAKVYELRGPDLIYEIDFCGAFQAGEFTTGQAVEFRVVGERLYVRRENDKEYNCQLEGTLKLENPNSAAEGTQTGGASSSPAVAAASASAAKLSITSVPDGADIEVDGNFSGNTPSDLEVPEGEHSITVKKLGYKNWERKMKVVAGSNIHLKAEMEKITNP